VDSGRDADAERFLSSRSGLDPDLAAAIVAARESRERDRELGESIPRQFGDFRILRRAGQGGMGIVYEAVQISLDRRVALKILPSGYLAEPKLVARFHREAKVTGSLRHPNIVAVYAMGVESGVPYYAMEYVEGMTLRDLVQWLNLGGAPVSDSGAQRDAKTKTLQPASHQAQHAEAEAEAEAGQDLECRPGQSRLPAPLIEALAASGIGRGNRPFEPSCLEPCYYRWLATAFAGAAEGLQEAHARGVVPPT